MMERKEVFSCSEFDVGCAKSIHHGIHVTDEKPFRECSRRLPPADLKDVRKHLNDLKEAGMISETKSTCASPIVMVCKKNGTIRICVDYKTLNKRTIPDQYTVPRVEDALSCLSGSKWFSVIIHLPSWLLSVGADAAMNLWSSGYISTSHGEDRC